MYLPITKDTLNDVLTYDFEHLYKLSLPEYTALLLLSILPDKNSDNTFNAEFYYSEVLLLANQSPDTRAFIDSTKDNIDTSKILQSIDLLETQKITLLDEQSVRSRIYLTPTNEWITGYKPSYVTDLLNSRFTFTSKTGQIRTASIEQTRNLNEFKAQSDEGFHLQGYAGTGKTTQLLQYLEHLSSSSAQTLLLAATQHQLNAISSRTKLGPKVVMKTFGRMAVDALMPQKAINKRFLRPDPSVEVTNNAQLIQLLNVQSHGQYSADSVMNLVRRTLHNWCLSDFSNITESSIPDRFRISLDHSTRAIVCVLAKELWHLIRTPVKDKYQPQVRDYHTIKWAAIQGATINSQYTHVVLDECHNLSYAVRQILNNSPQATLTLGDDFQGYGELQVRPKSNVRTREFCSSMRSGTETEDIINHIIDKHPTNATAPYAGNKNARTLIVPYNKPYIPEDDTIILAPDRWSLLEWCHRIVNNNIGVHLLTGQQDLDVFVRDIVALYTNGIRSNHPSLFRFLSWDQLSRHFKQNLSFKNVEKMLEQKYNLKKWTNTSYKMRKRDRVLKLALIRNSVNQEFDHVFLAPGIIPPDEKSLKQRDFYTDIYIANTRARKKLSIPIELLHWIEENANHF